MPIKKQGPSAKQREDLQKQANEQAKSNYQTESTNQHHGGHSGGNTHGGQQHEHTGPTLAEKAKQIEAAKRGGVSVDELKNMGIGVDGGHGSGGRMTGANKFEGSASEFGTAHIRDVDTGNYKQERTITHDFKKSLMQARTAKGLTQKELAQKIQESAATVQSYENGKAVPTGPVINKLNRALGVTLPKIPKKKVVADE